jgi:hypothetical protein
MTEFFAVMIVAGLTQAIIKDKHKACPYDTVIIW